jgi:hypothetical protein
MSRNLFRNVGQALAAWLRAFANKLEPKAATETDAAASSSTGDGPPAHWLERVRKDAPQLLHRAHLARTKLEQQPSKRGYPGPQQATVRETVRANPSPTYNGDFPADKNVHVPTPTPKSLSSFPSAGSRTAEANESGRANIIDSSRPTRPTEPSFLAQKERPLTTRVSYPFRRPIAPTLEKSSQTTSQAIDKKAEQPRSQLNGARFPAHVHRVEPNSAGNKATPNISKETHSFYEATQWPARRADAAPISVPQFPRSEPATERASAAYTQFLKHPAEKTIFTSQRFVREEIDSAAVEFPQEAEEDRWPALPMQRDSDRAAENAQVELEHLRRLALEQKGKLWIA